MAQQHELTAGFLFPDSPRRQSTGQHLRGMPVHTLRLAAAIAAVGMTVALATALTYPAPAPSSVEVSR